VHTDGGHGRAAGRVISNDLQAFPDCTLHSVFRGISNDLQAKTLFLHGFSKSVAAFVWFHRPLFRVVSRLLSACSFPCLPLFRSSPIKLFKFSFQLIFPVGSSLCGSRAVCIFPRIFVCYLQAPLDPGCWNIYR
jgi:hypothetical protein